MSDKIRLHHKDTKGTTLFVALVSLWFMVFFLIAQSYDKADIVITGAKVLTVDKNFSVVQALAVRGDRIVAAGTNDQIRKWSGPDTRVIDARGKMVIPGIIESHSHSTDVARNEAIQPYEEMTSIPVMQAWVRRMAAKKPDGEWIVIPRSYPTRLRERRFPTRAELDAADSRHPVMMDGAYSHVLNSVALEKAGIRQGSPPLSVGEVDRDAAGNPSGLLRNAGRYLSRFISSSAAPAEAVLDKLAAVHRVYASVGITSVMERGASLEDYRLYETLRRQNRLLLHSRVTLRVPGSSGAEAEQFLKGLSVKPNSGDEWLSAGPLKLVVDGGILIGTAFMREPYGARAMSLYNLADPTYRGSLSLKPEAITDIITAGHRAGWQMSSHVTGTAGTDMVLDSVEKTGRIKPIESSRYNLIHSYFPDKGVAARARRLGVCVDTQPAWFYKDADSLATALSSDLMQRFLGMREWLDAGVTVVANTDHMLGMDPNTALNPFNPFLTMYVMVTRKTQGGQIIGEKQKVTRGEALRMMTINAAYLTFDEKVKGSIEPGKLADLAMLSDDFLTCPADKIKDIRPIMTIVGGKVVYEKE